MSGPGEVARRWFRINTPTWIASAFGLDSSVAPRQLASALQGGVERATVQASLDITQGGLGMGAPVLSQLVQLTFAAPTVNFNAVVPGLVGTVPLILQMEILMGVTAAPRTITLTLGGIGNGSEISFFSEALASGTVRKWLDITGDATARFLMYAPIFQFTVAGFVAGESAFVVTHWMPIPKGIAPY